MTEVEFESSASELRM